MHPRVEQLPPPSPDYRRFLAVTQRRRPDRIPLIELAVHTRIVDTLLDETPPASGDARADQLEAARRNVRLLHRLDYDVVKISAPIPWDVRRLTATDAAQPAGPTPGARQWSDEHAGPIGSMADFERFAWPRPEDIDFGPVDAAAASLPDGMALVGFAGGVLEFAMDLVGMERFMLLTRRDPALVAAVIERVGGVVLKVFEAYCQMDAVRFVWLGDDLGHKHGLLMSPKFIEQHLIPWYRRLAEVAHHAGRPFLLHSCGSVEPLMPRFTEAGVDAKHSFEDAILPVEQFYDRWHEQVAVLGGVDVHLLATGDEASIRRRVIEITEHVGDRGGYACGSGNSIPDYVPAANYLTMVEAALGMRGA